MDPNLEEYTAVLPEGQEGDKNATGRGKGRHKTQKHRGVEHLETVWFPKSFWKGDGIFAYRSKWRRATGIWQLGVRDTKTPQSTGRYGTRRDRSIQNVLWRARRMPRQRERGRRGGRWKGKLRPGDRDHTSLPCGDKRPTEHGETCLWNDRSDVEDGAEAEPPETRRPGEHPDGCGGSSAKRAGSRREGRRGCWETPGRAHAAFRVCGDGSLLRMAVWSFRSHGIGSGGICLEKEDQSQHREPSNRGQSVRRGVCKSGTLKIDRHSVLRKTEADSEKINQTTTVKVAAAATLCVHGTHCSPASKASATCLHRY